MESCCWWSESSGDDDFLSPTVLYQIGIEFENDRSTARASVFVFGKEVRSDNIHDRLCIVKVEGWMPSVWIKYNDSVWPTLWDMRNAVNGLLRTAEVNAGVTETQCQTEMLSEQKKLDGYGFRTEEESFLEVKIGDSKVLREFRIAAEKAFRGCTYNAQVDPACQFAIETGLAEPNVLLVLPEDAVFRRVREQRAGGGGGWRYKYGTSTAWETVVTVDALSVRPNSENFVPKLRVMSVDIECIGSNSKFPNPFLPDNHVIQIATVVTDDVIREPDAVVKSAFVLGTCAHVEGLHNLNIHDSERDLLVAFVRHVRSVNPDILTGYNITGFDWPYILVRCDVNSIRPCFGRRPNSRWWVSNSKAMWRGSQEESGENVTTGDEEKNKKIMRLSTPDRIVVDMYTVVMAEHKLRQNSLNAVAEHFLGDRKEDMRYADIARFHAGTEEQRALIASYCVKDTVLPLQLMAKFNTVVCVLEIASVTGIPMRYVYERGQQVRVMTQIAREGYKRNIVFPTTPPTCYFNKGQQEDQRDDAGKAKNKRKRQEDEFEGATVVEPVVGYHECPVATLDFASLYPSIIIAFNLCYTTLQLSHPKCSATRESPLTEDGSAFRYGQGDASPTGDVFVPSKVRRGILPDILVALLNARKAVKIQMQEARDPFVRSVLNGRQLALKISANATYGFTGTSGSGGGMLPCVAIGRSVTGYGRELIDATMRCVDDGCVIYGDTDSVMIKMEGKSVAQAMVTAKSLAVGISRRFPEPVRLEFEKVYKPYLLLSKKKYVGAMYSNDPDRPEKMDAKGIEMVRRDCSPFVSRVIRECLYTLVMQSDLPGAVARAREAVQMLMSGKVAMEELILSKKYSRDDYVNEFQPHLVVEEKQRARGEEPYLLGDRIDYVIVRESVRDPGEMQRQARKFPEQFLKTCGRSGQTPVRKLCYRAENPAHVREHNIPIDYEYYVERQLEQPLMRLFEPVLGGEAKTRVAILPRSLLEKRGPTAAAPSTSKKKKKNHQPEMKQLSLREMWQR